MTIIKYFIKNISGISNSNVKKICIIYTSICKNALLPELKDRFADLKVFCGNLFKAHRI